MDGYMYVCIFVLKQLNVYFDTEENDHRILLGFVMQNKKQNSK